MCIYMFPFFYINRDLSDAINEVFTVKGLEKASATT
jgi:hypothetical protein